MKTAIRLLAGIAGALLVAGCQTTANAPERGRHLQWSGYRWAVKNEPQPVGPGPNPFSGKREDVFVDAQGQLHLNIVKRADHWMSTEIASFGSLGYGTYTFEVAGGATDTPGNAVLGLFTYDIEPADQHREIDIELSRWNDGRRENIQCALQPAELPHLVHRVPLVENPSGWTMSFRWSPGIVDCLITARPSVAGATPQVVTSHRFTRGVPRPGNEKVRLNFWLFRGGAPDTNKPAEVVIRSFAFSPLPE